jgi:hypothetical protein
MPSLNCRQLQSMAVKVAVVKVTENAIGIGLEAYGCRVSFCTLQLPISPT